MGRRAITVWVALSAWLAISGFKCDDSVGPGQAGPSAEKRPPAQLKLLVLTDPKGYLEPCGCNLRPLGGVDRLATIVGRARGQGLPLLVLAAGDLTFGSELHAADAEAAQAQEQMRAETLVGIWKGLGVAAVAPGPLDFAQGPKQLAAFAEQSGFPWLSETLRTGEALPPGLSRARILERGGLKVGVLGVQGPPDPAHPLPAGITVASDPVAEAKAAVARLRTQGAQLVIAMVHADRRTARRIAKTGADIVVVGGQDREAPVAPSTHAGAVLLHAGRQGQRVIEADVRVDGQGSLVDVSEWTREHARDGLKARITELKERIDGWQKDPATRDSADVKQQQARLAQLEKELDADPATTTAARWLAAKIIELDPDTPSDKQVAAKVDAHDRKVNAHNCEQLAHLKPAPVGQDEPSYVGAAACQRCHAPAFKWWREHPHGHAYATLESLHKNCNLSCVGCHVTGYNEPGGSTVTHLDTLKDVGCEVCHGPGSKHAANPKLAGAVRRDTPEKVCVTCHNQEHSKRFRYDAFRQMLIAPGHGQPVAQAPGSP